MQHCGMLLHLLRLSAHKVYDVTDLVEKDTATAY